MLVNVIGLGYIGLPTALILAQSKVDVVGSDYNDSLVNDLKNDILTFSENGMEQAFKAAKENGIRFQKEYESDADIFIVAVPTPFDETTKQIDPKYITSAVEEIVRISKDESIIVVESTVSPGTIDGTVRPIVESSHKNISIVHAPERIIPGSMFKELINNSRTIGADSVEIATIIENLYSKFCKGEIIKTDIRTAEMSKVVENTFRDVNIAFANELSRICHEIGIDVHEVIKIANMHPRVSILNPGPGVGGHCIPVDPWFLVGEYPENTELIHAARIVNDSQPLFIWDRVLSIMKENNLNDFSKVGIYGLTYKENVDDIRESPTLQLFKSGKENLNKVRVFDPHVNNRHLESQVFDFDEFIHDLDLMVIFVGHSDLKGRDIPKETIIFDTRNSKFDFKENKVVT